VAFLKAVECLARLSLTLLILSDWQTQISAAFPTLPDWQKHSSATFAILRNWLKQRRLGIF